MMLTQKDIQIIDGILSALAGYCAASKQRILDLLSDYLFTHDEYLQLAELECSKNTEQTSIDNNTHTT